MPHLFEMAAIAGLFALRLGVPLAITILVAWWLRRLDARWEEEARARQASQAVATGDVQPAAVTAPMALAKPCWFYRGCPEAKRSGCAAYSQPDLPCWMARLRADGRLPGGCYACVLFRTRPLLQEAPA